MLIRPSARVLALAPDNRVLLFRCDLDRVSWVPPGGGVEPGETFEEASLREFGEETGLSLARVGPCVMAVDDVGRHPDYGEQDIIFRCQTFLVRLTAVRGGAARSRDGATGRPRRLSLVVAPRPRTDRRGHFSPGIRDDRQRIALYKRS